MLYFDFIDLLYVAVGILFGFIIDDILRGVKDEE